MKPFSDKATLRSASEWFVLLRGADAADHQADFERWMADSDAHRRAYEQIEMAFRLGEGLPSFATERRERKPPAGHVPVRKKAAVVALSLGVVAVVAAGVMYRASELRPQPGKLAANQVSFTTPVGTIQPIRLSDKSLVTLDTKTSLREVFSSQRRDIWLDEGRARFDVAHEGRPFVVHVANGTVTARGTVFDVRVEHGRATVRLLRGAIDVDLAAAAGGERGHRHLSPGEVVAFDRHAGVIVVGLATLSQASQANWPQAILDVEQISVSDLVAEANRYSAAHIEVAAPDIANAKVSGRFRLGDADRLAGHLAELLGLEVMRSSGGGLVLRHPTGDPSDSSQQHQH